MRCVVLALVVGLVMRLAGPARAAEAGLRYTLRYLAPDTRRLQVRLQLPALPAGPRALVMPRAVPMGYGEQPYDRFVEQLRAVGSGGEALPVQRQEGPRWTLGQAEHTLAEVTYEIDLARQEREIPEAADASRARPGYAGLLLYSLLAFIEGLEGAPAQLRVEAPAAWPVLLSLAPRLPAPRGSAAASAPDFYELADSQAALGPDFALRRSEVTIGGRAVPLYLSLYSEAAGAAEAESTLALATEALQQVGAYFGAAPFAHYTALLERLRPLSPLHSYGMSMEHLSSGTFTLALASAAEEPARARYNLAHHMAHAWIPKRCQGRGYYPFSWELAPLIDTIWLSEGFVQYAALDALAAALPAAEGARYREAVVERRFRRALREAPPFLRQMGLVELSRVASTRYAKDFRTGRLCFSRGALMAEEMDQRIRAQTGGARGVREALRGLYATCERQRRPFEIAELGGVFQAATGVGVADILARWLAPLP